MVIRKNILTCICIWRCSLTVNVFAFDSLDVDDQILAGHTLSYEDVQEKYLDKLISQPNTFCVFVQDKVCVIKKCKSTLLYDLDIRTTKKLTLLKIAILHHTISAVYQFCWFRKGKVFSIVFYPIRLENIFGNCMLSFYSWSCNWIKLNMCSELKNLI